MQIKVVSQDGKVVIANSLPAAAGSILRSINISSLPKGSYFLKVTSSLKPPSPVPYSLQGEGREAQDEQVAKFEKQ